jgi:hypothetical protein
MNVLFTQHNSLGGANLFPNSQIYGCGPQSVPILDPKIVMLYHQAMGSSTNP